MPEAPEVGVGYVFGVFDLFHVGHLSTLQAAAQACGHLIVGVGADDLVQAVTGSRPFVPENERIAIVDAVGCVSAATALNSLDLRSELVRHQVSVVFVSHLAHDSLQHAVDLDTALAGTGVSVIRLPGERTTVSTAIGEALGNTTGGRAFG